MENPVRFLIALYFDEDVSVDIADILNKKGYDAVTALEAGMLTQSDEEQLAYAISQQRTIVTHNRDDFLDLHESFVNVQRKHYGIVIVKVRRPMEIVARLEKVLDEFTAEEMEMRILFV